MLLYIFILLFYCWVSTHVLWVSFGLLIRSIQSWIRHGIRGGMIIPTKKPSERRSLQYNKGKWKRGDSQVGIADSAPTEVQLQPAWRMAEVDMPVWEISPSVRPEQERVKWTCSFTWWEMRWMTFSPRYVWLTRKRWTTWSKRNLKLTFEVNQGTWYSNGPNSTSGDRRRVSSWTVLLLSCFV